MDRRQNHRFQLEVEKPILIESPETGAFQYAGTMTPEGLPPRPSVDLTRGLGDGKRMAIPFAGSSFAAQRSVASEQVVSSGLGSVPNIAKARNENNS